MHNNTSVVVANGIQLYYEQHGQGPDLLLITGLGGTVRSWQHQIPAFAPHFRVLAFDPRGSGRSDHPPAPYSVAQMAEDTLALCEAIGVSRFHVVGLGLGGMIAQSLAIDHPQRVHGMVLFSTVARADAYLRRLFEVWLELLPEVGWEKLGHVMSLFTFTPDFFEREAGRLRELEAARRHNDQPVFAYRAQVEAFCAYDRVDDLQRIQAPTLVLAGELDIETPVRFARVLAEKIPRARLEILPATGHRPHVETPERFNTIVLDFLRGLDAGTGV